MEELGIYRLHKSARKMHSIFLAMSRNKKAASEQGWLIFIIIALSDVMFITIQMSSVSWWHQMRLVSK